MSVNRPLVAGIVVAGVVASVGSSAQSPWRGDTYTSPPAGSWGGSASTPTNPSPQAPYYPAPSGEGSAPSYGGVCPGQSSGRQDVFPPMETYGATSPQDPGTAFPLAETPAAYGAQGIGGATPTYPQAPAGPAYSQPPSATGYPPTTTGTAFPPVQPATAYPPTTTGTAYPPQQSGTTFPSRQSATTYLPSQSGTTFPPSQSGTTFPPSQSGTTFPPSQSGTTFPLTSSGTAFPPPETSQVQVPSSQYPVKQYPQAIQPQNAHPQVYGGHAGTYPGAYPGTYPHTGLGYGVYPYGAAPFSFGDPVLRDSLFSGYGSGWGDGWGGGPWGGMPWF